jgi:hypothetical protein
MPVNNWGPFQTQSSLGTTGTQGYVSAIVGATNSSTPFNFRTAVIPAATGSPSGSSVGAKTDSQTKPSFPASASSGNQVGTSSISAPTPYSGLPAGNQGFLK